MLILKKEQDYNKKIKYDRLNLLKSQLSKLRESLKTLNKELIRENFLSNKGNKRKRKGNNI